MARTIRVLHILHAFSPGGLENGVVNLINHSPDHLVHELCFLSGGGEFLQRLRRPVAYHELNKPDGNDIRTVIRLHRLLRRSDIDIVHTRNWAAFDGVLAACLTPKPVLIHGEHGRDITDVGGTTRHRNIARRVLAYRMRKFVAVSNNLYAWLLATVGIPEKKLMLIPNGVDTERFRPQINRDLRKELGIAEDEFVVGAVGRLDPIKDHEGLIDAINAINDTGPERIRLVIVGDGPNRPKLVKLLNRSSCIPQPMLIGFRRDVENVYATFDVFALNSIAEGMSNTLLEAMACGLPVVCTSVGGNVELVADRRSGRLVQSGDKRALADAFRDYVRSPHTRASDGWNARRFVVEHFSLRSMVDRYVGLYESVA